MTIIKGDNTVIINGVKYKVDCSDLPANFHALQWYGDENYGEEEWLGREDRPPNSFIDNLDKYQVYIDRWNVKNDEWMAIVAESAKVDTILDPPT